MTVINELPIKFDHSMIIQTVTVYEHSLHTQIYIFVIDAFQIIHTFIITHVNNYISDYYIDCRNKLPQNVFECIEWVTKKNNKYSIEK